jgi:hypothetical protein
MDEQEMGNMKEQEMGSMEEQEIRNMKEQEMRNMYRRKRIRNMMAQEVGTWGKEGSGSKGIPTGRR